MYVNEKIFLFDCKLNILFIKCDGFNGELFKMFNIIVLII